MNTQQMAIKEKDLPYGFEEFLNCSMPETRLLGAILENAISDATRVYSSTTRYRGDDHKERAIQWIFEISNSERLDPFSFAWTCEHLGVCPHRLRIAVEHHVIAGTPFEITKQGMPKRKKA